MLGDVVKAVASRAVINAPNAFLFTLRSPPHFPGDAGRLQARHAWVTPLWILQVLSDEQAAVFSDRPNQVLGLRIYDDLRESPHEGSFLSQRIEPLNSGMVRTFTLSGDLTFFQALRSAQLAIGRVQIIGVVLISLGQNLQERAIKVLDIDILSVSLLIPEPSKEQIGEQ